MACKPNTIDDITSKFTVKITPLIKRESVYEGINTIIQLLYANMDNLMMTQGGEYHGQIGIITKPTLYTTLMTTEWKTPPDPGVYPRIPTNATVGLREKFNLKMMKE